jgi:hypothetical protein
MRCGDEHSINLNTGSLAGYTLCVVDEFPGQHGGVHDDDGYPGFPIVKHQTASMQPILRAQRLFFVKAAVDNDRKNRGRYVRGVRARKEVLARPAH